MEELKSREFGRLHFPSSQRSTTYLSNLARGKLRNRTKAHLKSEIRNFGLDGRSSNYRFRISDLRCRIRPISNSLCRGGEYFLQRVVRNGHRAPHMRDRAAVVAQAFFRAFEVAADDVDEWIDCDDDTGL